MFFPKLIAAPAGTEAAMENYGMNFGKNFDTVLTISEITSLGLFSM